MTQTIINRETGEVVTFEQRQEVLEKWHQALALAVEAKKVIEAEQALRKEVGNLFFLDPQEGVNTFELTEGWKLKFTYKIDRKIDEAALGAVGIQLKEVGITIDTLVEYKPSLVLKTYKGLVQVNPDAAKIFDQALTIKPASPTLELVAPK